jgi:4-amino-4-deoxy-L-arabinose transferase-like glycosyltransferase
MDDRQRDISGLTPTARLSRIDISGLTPTARLSRIDYLLLAGFVALLFSVSLAANRVLGNHETVHCQNAREMLADGDYIIPHYGGRPWLERPPLPFWITLPFLAVFGDGALVFRVVSLLVALPTVLLTGWMASVWFGRNVGLLSGCMLATLYEFHRYAMAPESDIFVCSLVAIGMALFVHLEFQYTQDASVSLFGPRPWSVLACSSCWGWATWSRGCTSPTCTCWPR